VCRNVVYDNVVCERVVCDNAVCEKVARDKVVCERVACDDVACEELCLKEFVNVCKSCMWQSMLFVNERCLKELCVESCVRKSCV